MNINRTWLILPGLLLLLTSEASKAQYTYTNETINYPTSSVSISTGDLNNTNNSEIVSFVPGIDGTATLTWQIILETDDCAAGVGITANGTNVVNVYGVADIYEDNPGTITITGGSPAFGGSPITFGVTAGTSYSFSGSGTIYNPEDTPLIGPASYSAKVVFPATPVITVNYYLYYSISNGAITITGYNGPDNVVTIPSSINGLPVTAIAAGAFEETGLEGITIPNSVTSIGVSAFDSCSNLTSVTISTGVTSIPDDAFYDCTALTSIAIPDGVTNIGAGAFLQSGLTSITIPNNVTTIGDGAFLGCHGLATVTVPDNVTSLGVQSFSGCTGLTSLTIGNSVTNIGEGAFQDCTGLTSVTIPNSVTTLGDDAFYVCFNISSITIGTNVTSIGASVFEGCTSLLNIVIPDSVTSIGNSVFYECTGLTNVTIGNGVTSLGDLFFFDCASLTSVTIGTRVTSIGGAAFEECSNLANITIPNNVISIEANAFYVCTGLTNVTIGSGVTNIELGAFYGCTNLTTVTIGSGVTSIGNEAFFFCDLEAVYFQGNAPSFDTAIFDPITQGTVYYSPGTSGWGSSFAFLPAVMLNPPNPSGSLRVSIMPAGAIAAGATWQVDGGVVQPSQATVLGLTVGNHTVSFSGANGWVTPTNQTVVVSANQLAMATATYVTQVPSVAVQPTSKTVTTGSNAQFTVSAVGALPLSFQWQFNGNNLADNGHIVGSQTNVLNIINVQTNDAGNYRVIVTNSFGSITSAVAALSVYFAPAITNQPQSQVVTAGTNATFSVGATGATPLFYQWQFNGTNLASATDSSYTVFNAQAGNGGNYSVQVFNDVGSVISSNAALTVTSPPVITNQPKNLNVVLGNASLLVVGVTGTAPLSFQWVRGGTNLPGATNRTLAFSNIQTNQAGNYWLVITNTYGSVTSSVAVVTVLTLPAITAQPQNQNVTIGSNATFTVGATGGNLGYQWRFNSGAISGATGSSYTVINAQTNNAGSYSVVVTNSQGTAASSNAVLTVSPAQPPQFQSVIVLSNGTVQIVLRGQSGSAYAIDGSPDLATWSQLVSFVMTNGTYQFTDMSATNNARGFYRGRLVP